MVSAAFPPDFVWGVATSSYQIEGAVHEDGRGESIWDRFAHTPGNTKNGDTGDIACDHYHRYPEDVAMMAALGVKAYRFSIAWPRILPLGSGTVNPKGLDFYSRLVDKLLEAGIEPYATLYHWDLPVAQHEAGGWESRDTVEAFADYAGAVAHHIGDRVKFWITHNEPWCTAFLGYQVGMFAPGIRNMRSALQVSHHILLSHGLAVGRIREAIRPDGQVGIAVNMEPVYPASDSREDIAAARRYDGYFNRWFLDPLAGRGYPQDMWDLYGGDVPHIEAGDLDTIAVPLDFIGLNYYHAPQIANDPGNPPLNLKQVDDPSRERTADRPITPGFLHESLIRLHREYGFQNIYVTENGAAFDDPPPAAGTVNDAGRVRFLKTHIGEVAQVLEEGVPVRGMFVWSLMDNFEWAQGYSLRYGIVHVDFTTQQRTPKDSARWYADYIAGRADLD